MPKLGTHKRPAIVRVRTMEKAQEILALCNQHGWQVIVGVEPNKPEDISDVNKLLGQSPQEKEGKPAGGGILSGLKQWAAKAAQASEPPLPQVGRNEPCPCGSGKKYKQCCYNQRARR